jgi:hypothetical protein
VIVNRFSKGPEGWCSYDYHASIVSGGRNVFVLATWEGSGGVDNDSHISVDNTRWSADTPEQPLSILPFLFYRSWIDEDPIDLRNAEVSVYLRGDDLQLDGARCLFWVHGEGGRWHLDTQPLHISDGAWSNEPLRFTLPDDQSAWHHSWPRTPDSMKSFPKLIQSVHSYGFSFVGFSREVAGRLSMGSFSIAQT